jgi:hypothetical protein
MWRSKCPQASAVITAWIITISIQLVSKNHFMKPAASKLSLGRRNYRSPIGMCNSRDCLNGLLSVAFVLADRQVRVNTDGVAVKSVCDR